MSCEFGRLGIDDELVSILGKWSPVCLLSLPLWKILQTVCQVISQALVMDCCKNLKSSSCVGKSLGMSVWVGQCSLTHTILMYFSFYLQFIVYRSSLHKANPSSLLLKSSKTVELKDVFYLTAKVKKSVFLSIPTETSSSPDVYNLNNCFCAKLLQIPVTYAGGVNTLADLERIKSAGFGGVDFTVGSALDIFGGDLQYRDVVSWHNQQLVATQ